MGSEKLWSVKDLAREAGVSGAYIRRLLADGRLRGEKLGGGWVVRDAEARRWLREREC